MREMTTQYFKLSNLIIEERFPNKEFIRNYTFV